MNWIGQPLKKQLHQQIFPLNDNNAWGGEKEKKWQDGDPPHLHELHFGIWGESKEDPFFWILKENQLNPQWDLDCLCCLPQPVMLYQAGGLAGQEAPRWKGQGGPEQANQGQIRLAFLFLSILFPLPFCVFCFICPITDLASWRTNKEPIVRRVRQINKIYECFQLVPKFYQILHHERDENLICSAL